MEYYQFYLSRRLRQKKAFTSIIEKAIISALESNCAYDEFFVIVFFENEYYRCECSFSKETSRCTICTLTCSAHKLLQLFSKDNIQKDTVKKYDYAYYRNEDFIEFDDYYCDNFPELVDYNSSIEDALGKIDSTSNKPVFVCGHYTTTKAVLYGIQMQLGKIIPVVERSEFSHNYRFNFSKRILRDPIYISETAKIPHYLGVNSLSVFIPIDGLTLDSSFWNEIKWKDIVPNDCIVSEIASVPCYYINISFEIDGFNNVFCRSVDGCGHEYYGLIYAPWGKPSANREATIEKPSQGAPQKPEHRLAYNELQTGNPDSHDSLRDDEDDVEKKYTDEKYTDNNYMQDNVAQGTQDEQRQDDNAVRIEIPEDAILSYTDIFTEQFVGGVEEVLIRDPFLYQTHHFKNLRNFIKALNTVVVESEGQTKLKRIVVETRRASKAADPRKDPKSKTFASDADYLAWIQERQDKEFAGLGKTLKKGGIRFRCSYLSFHDRKIKFSNGWTVDAGKGLDIFKKQEDDMQPVRCYECTFIFTYGKDDHTVQRIIKRPKS